MSVLLYWKTAFGIGTKAIYPSVSEKHGISLDEARKAYVQIGQQASNEGLVHNINYMKLTNTFDAHRLMHYAKTVGQEMEGMISSEHVTLHETSFVLKGYQLIT